MRGRHGAAVEDRVDGVVVLDSLHTEVGAVLFALGALA
jgi:hypothetical protein